MTLKINRERSERRKTEKNSVLGITNHRSAAVRWGGGAPGAPPMDPLVNTTNNKSMISKFSTLCKWVNFTLYYILI